MLRRKGSRRGITAGKAADELLADRDSEENFDDEDENVSFPSADYIVRILRIVIGSMTWMIWLT